MLFAMLPGSQDKDLAPSRGASVEWTWVKGLRRGVVWAIIVSAMLAAILDVLAAYVPTFVLNFWIRFALAFFVSWILFAVVHRAAGMAGTVCTTMAILAAAGVFISQHFVFAAYGVPTNSGKPLIGEMWFDPGIIIAANVSTCLGLLIASTLCHDGGEVWRTVVGALGTRV